MQEGQNEVYTDLEGKPSCSCKLVAENTELKRIVKYFYSQRMIDENGDEIFQLKLPFMRRVEKAIDVLKIRHYLISQYSPQPENIDDLAALLNTGRAREVHAKTNPHWGDGLYRLEEDTLTMIAHNWDSND